MMRTLLYILLFTGLSYGQNFKDIETLDGFVTIERGVKFTRAINLSKGDTIRLKVKINELKGRGAYLIGLPNYKKSFGFYTSSGKIRATSRFETADITVRNLAGQLLRNNNIPKSEWLELTAVLNQPVQKLVLGRHLYKGDQYQVRELKANGIDLLPLEKKPLAITQGNFFTKNDTLFIRVFDGMATPEDFGWKPIYSNDTTQWRDASEVLERCFNSGYGCRLKGGIYPISKGILIHKPTSIHLSGRGIVNEYLDNHSLSKIIPLGDFDVITIKSKDVYLYGGVIYTGLTRHNSAAIKYHPDGRIWGGVIYGLTIEGKREHLYQAGAGTRGIDFETQELSVYDPHASYLDFVNLRFEWLYSGIGKKAKSDQVKAMRKGNEYGLWINSLSILNPKFIGVKKALDFEWGSNIYMSNANVQDYNVLAEAEKNTPIITCRCSHSFIEYQPYDMKFSSIIKVDGKPIYRHRYYVEKLPDSVKNGKTSIFINRFLKN